MGIAKAHAGSDIIPGKFATRPQGKDLIFAALASNHFHSKLRSRNGGAAGIFDQTIYVLTAETTRQVLLVAALASAEVKKVEISSYLLVLRQRSSKFYLAKRSSSFLPF